MEFCIHTVLIAELKRKLWWTLTVPAKMFITNSSHCPNTILALYKVSSPSWLRTSWLTSHLTPPLTRLSSHCCWRLTSSPARACIRARPLSPASWSSWRPAPPRWSSWRAPWPHPAMGRGPASCPARGTTSLRTSQPSSRPWQVWSVRGNCRPKFPPAPVPAQRIHNWWTCCTAHFRWDFTERVRGSERFSMYFRPELASTRRKQTVRGRQVLLQPLLQPRPLLLLQQNP